MLTDTQKADVKEISRHIKALDRESLHIVSAAVSVLLAKQNLDKEKLPSEDGTPPEDQKTA